MFELKPLPYAYDALEPHIDQETMKIHHDKHHQAYLNKFKLAWQEFPELKDLTAEQVLWRLEELKEKIDEKSWVALKNHGGGFVHHKVFWEIMSPDGSREPVGELKEKIKDLGNFKDFKKDFTDLALGQFGSGWAWLVMDEQGTLRTYALPNQDSPLSFRHHILLGVDVWEHAYYLKYQNRRADYLESWWNVLDFDAVEKRYQAALAKIK